MNDYQTSVHGLQWWYNIDMDTERETRTKSTEIPPGLKPHFQEYDMATLDLERDANLIIQRTLENGTWEEIRWLFAAYNSMQIRRFVRERGERLLSPVTFNYWRKLLRIRHWHRSPFGAEKMAVWGS